jgi:hypothetical protein
MPKRKPDLELGYVTLTLEAMDRIGRTFLAEEAAWRGRLGVPRGFEIPPKPLPKTWEDLEQELEAVTRLELEGYEVVMSAPHGPVHEGFAFQMVKSRDRRWTLEALQKQWLKARRRCRRRVRKGKARPRLVPTDDGE